MMIAVVLAGCARSTVETRRQERWGAYTGLSPEHQQMVDRGEVKYGMNEDAVYIAWGKPRQVLQAGDAKGETTTWLYEGTTSDTTYYWRVYEIQRKDGTVYLDRRLESNTDFHHYISAELIFREGRLESWRTLPRPASRTRWMPGPGY